MGRHEKQNELWVESVNLANEWGQFLTIDILGWAG